MLKSLKSWLKRNTGIQSLSDKSKEIWHQVVSGQKQVLATIRRESEEQRFITGQHLVMLSQLLPEPKTLQEAEFKVFSQWGEDGIIQYLIRKCNIEPKIFIEFGVENYLEANTRFLLKHNNWKGLIIDGSPGHMDYVKADSISWRHDLTAVAAFITRENINDLFLKAGFKGKIGILSVDIDGNDYWVWEAISVVEPIMVIAEYNSYFGNDRAISTPYDPAFYRTNAHYSNLYFGASLAALCYLADKKGFALVGCTTAGNNAFFIKKEHLNGLKPLSPQEGYIESLARESRDPDGKLTFVSGEARLKLIAGLPVVNVITGETESL
jgi:hypothetical protein